MAKNTISAFTMRQLVESAVVTAAFVNSLPIAATDADGKFIFSARDVGKAQAHAQHLLDKLLEAAATDVIVEAAA